MTAASLPILYFLAACLLIAEHVFPAHPTNPDYRWYLRAVSINAMQLLVFFLVDALWSHWSGRFALLHLGRVAGPLTGAGIAYFIFTFVIYWWHRARHASPWIWRMFHQLHHSPQRIQTLTAYYIHPLDMTATLFISNTIVYVLLGLNFEAAAWYVLITGFAGFFIHANIRVPRQVGYVFQTPEMHRLHHKSGHHAHNYSDIVWWDMLFGTYLNPNEDIQQCGFDAASERRVIPMLLGHYLDNEGK